jgi:phage gpG-like protein
MVAAVHMAGGRQTRSKAKALPAPPLASSDSEEEETTFEVDAQFMQVLSRAYFL